MVFARAVPLGLLVAGVLWLAFDSQLLTPDPPPPGTPLAIGALALVFGAGSLVMHYGGEPRRGPLLLGMALGLGGWAMGRLLGF